MNHSLLLIKGKDDAFAALLRRAMENVFPGSVTKVIENIDSDLDTSNSAVVEILVVVDPIETELSKIESIFNARKLPRWAVIACEGPLAPAQWTDALAPVILKASWTAQSLRRQNATLRGTIRSLGVRVAHDMRTPLGGILSAAETLREGLAESSPENLVWVDNIIDSEGDLLKLVRHQTMLADELSRLPEISLFSMGDAVGDALQWVEGKLTLANASVNKPAEWPEVTGDRKKFERVWILLLENSVRHGGAGRRIELGWEKISDGYKFWVSNDGPAIPVEKLPMLFRPFHLLHEPNSGRGLSLSLMEELVHSLGGISGYEVGSKGNPTFFFTVV